MQTEKGPTGGMRNWMWLAAHPWMVHPPWLVLLAFDVVVAADVGVAIAAEWWLNHNYKVVT